MTRPRRRRPRRALALRLLAAVVFVGGLLGTGAVTTNALGAGDRFERLVARVDRFFNPPPAIPVDDELVVARPSAPAAPVPTPEPTPLPSRAPGVTPAPPTPAPTPTPEPTRAPVDVDLLADAGVDPQSVFVSQYDKDACAPSGVQMTLAVLGLVEPTPAVQKAIDARVREWESWHDSHNGNWGPTAIARALTAYGASDYKVRVYESRADALYDAALAIRTTGKPVVLLTWRGAHTWVMTGYRANADPALFPDASVTGAYILDPWYPRVSSIWGPSDPPGTFQDAAEMKRNFLPWRRPEGSYPKRDGRFIAVVPTEPLTTASGS